MTSAARPIRILFAFLLATSNLSAQSLYNDRADAAVQSFLLKFWSGSDQYLRHQYPSDGQLTGYWTYANGWNSVLDSIERTGRTRYNGWIEGFYIGQNERGWASDYYDDECWMCMALIHAYDLASDSKYLSRAETIFTEVQNAWDTTCCGTTPGGVWWDRAHSQKATASNAGAAFVAARLYRRTGNAAYLTFARQVYAYWFAQMVNQFTGQVCDHITPTGEKVWWKFTYNEGLMIEAALESYEATGEAAFLTNAHKFATFMVSNEVASTAYGNVLSDGSSASCTGDCSQFKAPAYRALMRLFAKDRTRTAYANVLRASEEGIWNLARNADLNIFTTSWAGPPESIIEMPEQDSAVAALSRFAQQNETNTFSLTNRFEAEEAIVHHIPLEALYDGFSGWAYLAGWNQNGQSVDFRVNLPAPGTYTLSFRYSAGAGNAVRALLVNGAVAVTSLTFNNTGAWSSYNSATVTRSFTKVGENVITLAFDSTRNSANYLNLDFLQIANDTPPGPGALNAKLVRPHIVLSWTGPGFLQSATAANGPWSDVIGHPASPATLLMPATDTRYFRVRD